MTPRAVGSPKSPCRKCRPPFLAYAARARFERASTFEDKRQFLVDFVGRVVYDHYRVAVIGSVSIKTKIHNSQHSQEIETRKPLPRPSNGLELMSNATSTLCRGPPALGRPRQRVVAAQADLGASRVSGRRRPDRESLPAGIDPCGRFHRSRRFAGRRAARRIRPHPRGILEWGPPGPSRA